MSIQTEIANHFKRVAQLRIDYKNEISESKRKFIVVLAKAHKKDIERLREKEKSAADVIK